MSVRRSRAVRALPSLIAKLSARARSVRCGLRRVGCACHPGSHSDVFTPAAAFGSGVDRGAVRLLRDRADSLHTKTP
jgi:hypothetical protein